jgi:hypothetical protein
MEQQLEKGIPEWFSRTFAPAARQKWNGVTQHQRWYEIPYGMVREKVGQAMRDAIIQQDRRRLSQKNHRLALRNAIRSRTTSKADFTFDECVARTA